VNKEEGVFFYRIFCCLKPSIDGFLNGCRPFLSIDSAALNGRWSGHLSSVTTIDGHNWMFSVAFGFFDGETTDNWTWFYAAAAKGNWESTAPSYKFRCLQGSRECREEGIP
jgi:hypothetical protein